MRKIKYLVIALTLVVGSVNANPVSLGTAQKVAANFYTQNYNASATLTLVYTERSSDGQPVYFVFDVNNEGGFVIVSAEDAGFPIIGSSNTGHYVIPAANNNVDFWMTKRKNEVIAMRANNAKASQEITQTWTSYINNTPDKTKSQTLSSVNPLCSTTWDQSPYYNAMCPHNSVTGCVATAMAQIMKYWKYPSVGVGSTCYYDETQYGFQENYGELCATFDTSHYVWSAMPNNVTSANKEVAKLMYDCGVSVNMDYSPSGSGAVVIGPYPAAEDAYAQFFNYNSYYIDGVMEASYTTSAWISLLENELNNKRPVQYQGTDPTQGGHSWVCDGYNTSGQLHMNWGWSGYDDGYFTATSLSVDGYDFSEAVGAIIGIEPAVLAVPEVNSNASVNVYPNPSHGVFTFEMPGNVVNSQIIIYNLLGQEVDTYKVNAGTIQIDLGNQPKGVYLYRYLNEKGESVSTGKLVIE
jgi:hypothetical protein